MKWRAGVAMLAVLLLALPVMAGEQAAKTYPTEVTYPTRQAVSPPLRDLPQFMGPIVPGPDREIPNKVNPRAGKIGPAGLVDPLVPSVIGPLAAPAPLLSFEGTNNLDNQALVGFKLSPPDTQGDIGPNDYVQWNNLIYAVYDRTGAKRAGFPKAGNVLFSALVGSACATSNDGDPITLYDQLANRWFMSQFALPNYPSGPFYQCIAVSTTGDPTGTYNLYEYTYSATIMNDYPKFGVWPDAYYFSANQFYGGSGVGVMAFDRAAMLAGTPANAVYFNMGAIDGTLWSLLPADLDGSTPPPAGTPGIFLQLDGLGFGDPADQVELWQLAFNVTNPPASTFTKFATIPVAAYDSDLCTASRETCIDQPGTSQKLEAISDRPMHRLAYRNYGTHQSMVTTHTVDVSGSGRAGKRWYEFRNAGAGWVLHDQGTFAPGADTHHRWMGSIAQDASGDLALGYSVSSTTLAPSVRYTVRQPGDPAGTMQAEAELIAGGGGQTGSARWGDYSMMGIDPVDDCTFWYTQEYMAAATVVDWQTRIGSFKIPSCSTGPTGTVQGTVLSTAGGTPIEGAQVQVGAYGTTTNASGFYTIKVPVDTYSVTASKFGFGPQTVTDVEVDEGVTTTQNFNLTPVGTYFVDGFVTAAEHLWPLWAKIDIKTGSTVVGTYYTSPWNGYYEIELANGFTYDFTVHSMYTGYIDQVRPVTVAAADQTQSFTLLAASGNPAYTCILEGGINENFEGDFPPGGWTVKNLGSVPNNVWKRNDKWGATPRANMTGGTGFCASADSDKAGSGSGLFDTELWSPPIVMPATPRNLKFKSAYASWSGQTGTFSVSTNGGSTWTPLLTLTTSSSGDQTIDMTAYASQTIILRWKFVSGSYAMYWQVDDVRTETIPPPQPPPILSEGFESTTFPPTGWAAYNVDGGGTAWARSTSYKRTGLAGANHGYSSAGMQDGWLVTPAVAIPAGGADLRFWQYDTFGGAFPNTDSVMVCTSSCTTPPTNFTLVTAVPTATSTWTERVISLSAYAGMTRYFAFRYQGDDTGNWSIDDVLIPSAPPPPVVVDTPTLVCSAVQGSMVAGFVTDDNTTNGIVGADVVRDLGGATQTMVATGNLPAGFYYMFSAKPVVTAPEGPATRKFTASKDGYGTVEQLVNLIPDTVNRLDFALPAASLSLADWPSAFPIDGRLTPDGLPAWDKTDMFSILNSGGLPADVKLNAMSISSTFRHRWPAFVPETPTKQSKSSIGRVPNAPVPSNRTRHPELAGALAGVPAFGVEILAGGVGNLKTWPDASVPGTWTQVASEAAWYFAGDFLNGDFSKLYVLDYALNQLHTLDTTTGAATVIGPSVPEGTESWSGLKGSSDGNVYAVGTTCSASTLYTINPATGAVTKVGAITNGACVIDLAINKDGEIYGVDLVSDNLLEINPATGAGTVVGSLGIDANYGQGMDFEEESGILYWAAVNGGTLVGELRTINTDTGASFLIGSFPGGAQVDAFAIASGGAGGGLPWFVLDPTEGTVPADGQLDIDAEFFPEGVAPAHYGLFRAVIKSTNDTPAALPDIPVFFTKAFWDVPRGHWADQFIHALAGVRVTKGCGEGNFCPEANINRADMAILMVRAIHGPDFAPPPAVGIFVDVVISDTDTTADYIEQLYHDGVVAGCAVGGGGERYYCPADLVNRAQMAVFVAAGLEIPVVPPTGYFTDVHGTGYAWAEGHIEAIFNEGITAGCGNHLFCPGDNITRAQLAVWLTVALDLPTYLHPMAP